MPLYPPRTLAPIKQQETLAKREARLMAALAHPERAARIARAVDEVRASQLAILKARSELVRYKPDTTQKTRQLESIEAAETLWRTLTAEDIVSRYAKDPATLRGTGRDQIQHADE